MGRNGRGLCYEPCLVYYQHGARSSKGSASLAPCLHAHCSRDSRSGLQQRLLLQRPSVASLGSMNVANVVVEWCRSCKEGCSFDLTMIL